MFYFLAASVVVFILLKIKNIDIWFWGYVKSKLYLLKSRPDPSKPIHIYFCFADHFEPGCRPDYARGLRRVNVWLEKYPPIARKFKDFYGRHPQHTFFYPEELYIPEFLDKLASIKKMGLGDVEIHLHHDNDTADNFRKTITGFKNLLHEKHNLLHKNPKTGEIEYAFIHGNWALDNSGKNGKACGINNEITLLKETGCYVDLTLPSAPSSTQTAKVNSIYYAKDNQLKPKSHNDGVDVEVGKPPSGDLMLIQGPLTFNWKESRRRMFLIPKVENADISLSHKASKHRIDLWVKQRIHVRGAPNHIFIKVHTHGTQEPNEDVLLGENIEAMHAYLTSKYNDGKKYILHYVTAREMYQKVVDIRDGKI